MKRLNRARWAALLTSIAALAAGQFVAGYGAVEAGVFTAALITYVSAGALAASLPCRVQPGWFAVRPARLTASRVRLAVWLGVEVVLGALGAVTFVAGWQHPLLRASVVMSGIALWHLFPVPSTPTGRLARVTGPQRTVAVVAAVTGLAAVGAGWWSGVVVIVGALGALARVVKFPGGVDRSLRVVGVPVGHAGARVKPAGAGQWWVELGEGRHLAVEVDAGADLFDVLGEHPSQMWFVGVDNGTPVCRVDPVLLQALSLGESQLLHA